MMNDSCIKCVDCVSCVECSECTRCTNCVLCWGLVGVKDYVCNLPKDTWYKLPHKMMEAAIERALDRRWIYIKDRLIARNIDLIMAEGRGCKRASYGDAEGNNCNCHDCPGCEDCGQSTFCLDCRHCRECSGCIACVDCIMCFDLNGRKGFICNLQADAWHKLEPKSKQKSVETALTEMWKYDRENVIKREMSVICQCLSSWTQ